MTNERVSLVRPDGTSGTIEADALRALAGYIEQREAAEEAGPNDCTCWATSRNGCPQHHDTLPGTHRIVS
jgi:hypothetical protein